MRSQLPSLLSGCLHTLPHSTTTYVSPIDVLFTSRKRSLKACEGAATQLQYCKQSLRANSRGPCGQAGGGGEGGHPQQVSL